MTTNSNQNQNDIEHLRLLSIFHYVVSAITALFALFPVIHLIIGLMIIFAPQNLDGKGNPPPVFIGWFFVVIAAAFICIGWTLAAAIFLAGRSLARRKRYLFCLVIAALECIFMPFGTVLGVFTIIVLMRPSVKELFETKTNNT